MQRTAGLRGFLPALASLAIAIGLHVVLARLFGPTFAGIQLLYIVIVLVSGWCGFLPGMSVVALTVVIVPMIFRPGFTLAQVNVSAFLVLLSIGLLASTVAAARRRIEDVLRAANSELDRRVREQTSDLAVRLAEIDAIYDQMIIGVCFLDTNGQFVRVNERLALLNGRAATEHVGLRLTSVLNPDVAERLREMHGRVLRTGEAVVDEEYTGCWGDEAVRDWLLSCSPVRSGERLLGVQVFVHEVTERRVAERQLVAANEELRRANADLEQFTYSASHDLQEPLRMVSIFTQLLQDRYAEQLDATGNMYVRHAVSGAQRMHRLVSGLRSYLQLSGVEDTPEETDPTIVVARVLETLAPKIDGCAARICVDVLPPLRMRELHLEQLLHNLIGNALKYRSDDVPSIHISAQVAGESHTVTIADNGIGIDPQYAEQVFVIFKRLHSSDEYDGTGIGLAICQKIVQRYGGSIWVEPATKGSRFCFRIPQ